jgi:fructokinase
MAHPIRIGVDFGGTKLEVIALAADGRELFRKRTATPAGDYTGQIAAVAALVAELEQAVGAGGTIGVGIPGAISPATGLIKNANSTWLNGKPFVRDVERSLKRPVRLANDADCFTLSEATDGAGANGNTVFGVIIGTGTGGGIVVNRRLCSGPNAIAGEWGHNMLPWPQNTDEWPGPACYCGRTGCIETFLSGPGLERDYHTASGHALKTLEICARAAGGDAIAEGALARYEHRLARGLASIINVLDPAVIVLGGGMSNLPGLSRAVMALLPNYVFSDSVATPVVPNAHGDSSGVRGAAWLWPA